MAEMHSKVLTKQHSVFKTPICVRTAPPFNECKKKTPTTIMIRSSSDSGPTRSISIPSPSSLTASVYAGGSESVDGHCFLEECGPGDFSLELNPTLTWPVTWHKKLLSLHHLFLNQSFRKHLKIPWQPFVYSKSLKKQSKTSENRLIDKNDAQKNILN